MDIVTVTGCRPLFKTRALELIDNNHPVVYMGVVAANGCPADVYLRGHKVQVVFAPDVAVHFTISVPHAMGVQETSKYITDGPYRVNLLNAASVVDEVTINKVVYAAYELAKPYALAEIQLRNIALMIEEMHNKLATSSINDIKTILGV